MLPDERASRDLCCCMWTRPIFSEINTGGGWRVAASWRCSPTLSVRRFALPNRSYDDSGVRLARIVACEAGSVSSSRSVAIFFFFCVGELPDVFSSWLVNWYDIFVSLRGFRQNYFSYRCITTDFFFFFLLVSRHFESHVQVCESPKAPKDSRIRNLGRRVKRASHLPRPFVVLNKPV